MSAARVASERAEEDVSRAACMPKDKRVQLDFQSIDLIIDAVTERFDGLDVLLNNAGVASTGHFADGTEAILRQVMEVNFFAPAELIRLAVPVLTRGRQPAVLNVASMTSVEM